LRWSSRPIRVSSFCYSIGASTRSWPGLELLLLDRSLDEELAAFRTVQPAGRTVVVVDPAYAASVPSSSDAEIHPCDDPDVCVATLDPEARGVVLGPVPRLTVAQRRLLIDGLRDRGIATWSLSGPGDVEIGALATDVPSPDKARTRRLSVWIAQIVRGGDTGALSVGMSMRPRLVVNGATAAALGIAFKPSILRRAEVLEADSLGPLRPFLRFFSTADTRPRTSRRPSAPADWSVTVPCRRASTPDRSSGTTR